MNILSFDTSSENISFHILWRDKTIVTYNQRQPYGSMALLNTFDEIFKKNSLSLSELDLLVIGSGPGSFTGLRIGFSIAKAWGVAFPSLAVIPIGSFYSMACQLEEKHNNIAVITDARKGLIYATTYCITHGHIKQTGKALLTTIKNFVPQKKEYLFVTYDNNLRNKVIQIYPRINFYHHTIFPSAKHLIPLAIEYYKTKKYSPISKLEPLYLHPKTCQIKVK